jgi:hypothetical protein
MGDERLVSPTLGGSALGFYGINGRGVGVSKKYLSVLFILYYILQCPLLHPRSVSSGL